MRLAIYAHFDSEENVQKHILFYLQELKDLGFAIYFVSNSPLSNSNVSALEKICSQVVQRENRGLDFAMWKHGIKDVNLVEVDELLLTNSSIIGPLTPLRFCFENNLIADCDFWGMTDSIEIAQHLQSYFLVFRRKVIQSKAFSRFWDSVIPYSDKDQIIRSYEVGLTEWLKEQGFRWKALYTYKDVTSKFRQSQNFFLRSIHNLRRLLTGMLWRQKSRGIYFRILKKLLYLNSYNKNTAFCFPDVLVFEKMPFIKASLLRTGNARLTPQSIFQLLTKSSLPAAAVVELQEKHRVE